MKAYIGIRIIPDNLEPIGSINSQPLFKTEYTRSEKTDSSFLVFSVHNETTVRMHQITQITD